MIIKINTWLLIAVTVPRVGSDVSGSIPGCQTPGCQQYLTIQATRATGKYPAADIRTFLNKSARDKKEVRAAKKLSRCFNRPVLTSSESTLYADTCPSTRHIFQFPKSVLYQNYQCWVLRPWSSLKCSYVGCVMRSCRGATGIVAPFFPGVLACVHTHFETIQYYIWCPKLGKVIVQYLRLPQCCSCMRLRRPGFQPKRTYT